MGATVNSIWLPWGLGAGMGLWSFLSSVGRIVVAVMVIILSSTVSPSVLPVSEKMGGLSYLPVGVYRSRSSCLGYLRCSGDNRDALPCLRHWALRQID